MPYKYSELSVCETNSLAELVATCEDLSLSTSGTKTELCKRIMAALPKKVGTGSYGCVYNKPIPCRKPWSGAGKPGIVSKWMKKKHARAEILEHKKLKLHEIDPDNKQYISKPHICQPTKKVAKHVEPCKDDYTGDNTWMLMYTDGGVSLGQLLESGIALERVLYGLKNVFLGVSVMNGHGKYHLDLKPDNIVVKGAPDGTQIYRLIDFGISQDLGGRPFINYGLYSSTYYLWPPDIIFLTGMIETAIARGREPPAMTVEQIDTQVDSYLSKVATNYIGDKFVSNTFYDNDIVEMKANIALIIKNHQDLYKLIDGKAYYDAVASKLDVFGLGTLLMLLVRKYESSQPDLVDIVLKFINNNKILSYNPRDRPTPNALYRKYVQMIDSAIGELV